MNYDLNDIQASSSPTQDLEESIKQCLSDVETGEDLETYNITAEVNQTATASAEQNDIDRIKADCK